MCLTSPGHFLRGWRGGKATSAEVLSGLIERMVRGQVELRNRVRHYPEYSDPSTQAHGLPGCAEEDAYRGWSDDGRFGDLEAEARKLADWRYEHLTGGGREDGAAERAPEGAPELAEVAPEGGGLEEGEAERAPEVAPELAPAGGACALQAAAGYAEHARALAARVERAAWRQFVELWMSRESPCDLTATGSSSGPCQRACTLRRATDRQEDTRSLQKEFARYVYFADLHKCPADRKRSKGHSAPLKQVLI